MNTYNVPTGEQPLNAWIVILIVVAGLLLLASVIYPYLPKIIEVFKEKFCNKKEDTREDLD